NSRAGSHIDRAENHDEADDNLQRDDPFRGERILHTLSNYDSEVHGTFDDDHVRERQRKQGQQEKRRQCEENRLGTAGQPQKQQDECRSHPRAAPRKEQFQPPEVARRSGCSESVSEKKKKWENRHDRDDEKRPLEGRVPSFGSDSKWHPSS